MPLFRVAVKQSRNSNRVRLEKECQLLIAIDCSFVLSIPETKIYDQDSTSICTNKWYKLDNVKEYYELFEKNRDLFEYVK